MTKTLPKILLGCDKDVANVVARSFKNRGIDVHTGVQVHGHQPNDGGGTTVSFGATTISTERVMHTPT